MRLSLNKMKKNRIPLLMEEDNSPKKRNYLNLFLGLAFFGYGAYRIFTFFNGDQYSNFRLIIAIGFVILGALDLYKFIKPQN